MTVGGEGFSPLQKGDFATLMRENSCKNLLALASVPFAFPSQCGFDFPETWVW